MTSNFTLIEATEIGPVFMFVVQATDGIYTVLTFSDPGKDTVVDPEGNSHGYYMNAKFAALDTFIQAVIEEQF